MALREANYGFSRRIADRGNDKIMFDSQDRKIQETDSKDVIWDEIVGKEEHPEFYDGYKFLETDSDAFIRDENYGKEEYPGSCSVIYPSPPCFDEYRDEDWYSWVTGGDGKLLGDELGVKSLKADGSVQVTIDESGKFVTEEINISYIKNSVGCDESHNMVAMGGGAPDWEIPVFRQSIDESWNFEFQKVSHPTKSGFSIGSDFKIIYKKISVDKKVIYDNFGVVDKFTNEKMPNNVENFNSNGDNPIHGWTTFAKMGHRQESGPPFMYIASVAKAQDTSFVGLTATRIRGQNTDLHYGISAKRWNNELFYSFVNGKYVEDGKTRLLYDPSHVDQNGENVVELNYQFIKNGFHLSSYIVGAKSLTRDKTTQEVELFMRFVKIMITGNRVDVPFDPGGFGPKAKLGDEFFSKTGSMMQEHPYYLLFI